MGVYKDIDLARQHGEPFVFLHGFRAKYWCCTCCLRNAHKIKKIHHAVECTAKPKENQP